MDTTIKETTMTDQNERDATILILRKELKRRSGKTWSVKGGKGTAWGWISINVPPARRDVYGAMSDTERTELAALLGLDHVHHQGVSIPASTAHRTEYVDRVRGLAPVKVAAPYWD